MKYIFVTGGVVSSLGKGLAASILHQHDFAVRPEGNGILERLQLRRVPDLHFTLDNSQEYSERIDQLLKEMKKGNPSPK